MSSHRRTFLAQLASAGAVALAPTVGCTKPASGRRDQKKNKKAPAAAAVAPRVVLVRCAAAVGSGLKVERSALRRMLQLGLKRLGGVKDPRAALSQWIRPTDTVGLKVNCLAGRQMSTHPELVEELVALLEGAGLPRRQNIVFDRADIDLRRGGFPIRVSGSDYRSMGNDRAGYERDLHVMKNGASRFSQVATRKASVLINLPILKDHGLAGLSGALKNNFGLIHNPNKFHLNGCDPHVAEVNAWDFVRRKQRLVICDALRVQTEGGPAFHAAGAVTYGGLLLANDPVALDLVAWELLDRLRAQRKLPSLAKDKRKPVHVLTAAKQGLGVASRSKVELIELKVT
jgi:uncharacterized protein (DUF362 family)